MEWEQIDNYHNRAKIRGGWLVKAYEPTAASLERMTLVAMCFVPDPMHAWTL